MRGNCDFHKNNTFLFYRWDDCQTRQSWEVFLLRGNSENKCKARHSRWRANDKKMWLNAMRLHTNIMSFGCRLNLSTIYLHREIKNSSCVIVSEKLLTFHLIFFLQQIMKKEYLYKSASKESTDKLKTRCLSYRKILMTSIY